MGNFQRTLWRTCGASLVAVLAGAASALTPPGYQPPLLLTIHDSQAPVLDCVAAALREENYIVVPLTLTASACVTWTDVACEIWVPQTGPAVAWSVGTSLMAPATILGHEAAHCWLHQYHGLVPWF